MMGQANDCMQRTRRLRFVSVLNVYWRRVADAQRSATRHNDQRGNHLCLHNHRQKREKITMRCSKC